jgi:hypothetical protein
MGHKHINTLKTGPTTAPSQERVGEENKVKVMRNVDDVRTTDAKAQEPRVRTYSEIVGKPKKEKEKNIRA